MIIKSAAERGISHGDDVTVQVFQIFFQEALTPKLYEEVLTKGLTTWIRFHIFPFVLSRNRAETSPLRDLFVATILPGMHSRATSFQYFCNNNVQATGNGKKGRKKWGGTTVTGATRDMSQCLAWSFSCRHCRHEIDNGTVQMTFLACIPAAYGQTHIAEVLFRNDSGILFGNT